MNDPPKIIEDYIKELVEREVIEETKGRCDREAKQDGAFEDRILGESYS